MTGKKNKSARHTPALSIDQKASIFHEVDHQDCHEILDWKLFENEQSKANWRLFAIRVEFGHCHHRVLVPVLAEFVRKLYPDMEFDEASKYDPKYYLLKIQKAIEEINPNLTSIPDGTLELVDRCLNGRNAVAHFNKEEITNHWESYLLNYSKLCKWIEEHPYKAATEIKHIKQKMAKHYGRSLCRPIS